MRMLTCLLEVVVMMAISAPVLGQCTGCPLRCDVKDEFGENFFLRDGDVYMIYGDSITDGSIYARTLENYVLTRFPVWRVTFYNHGWGGDVASNLARVERDVLPFAPTVFTEAMGMNDASYTIPSEGPLQRYLEAYRQMIPMLRQANPDVRIALVSAIPYENMAGSGRADGAYAQTLGMLARYKEQLARTLGVEFIDLFTGYGEKMGLGKVIYPDFVLSGDGIHPGPAGQTMIAQVILEGMNAPALVSCLKLDVTGDQAKVADAVRCQAKDIAVTDGVVSFGRLARSLPCPVEQVNPTIKRFLDAVEFSEEINRDMLFVRGLAAPAYELKIDDVSIGVYSADELAIGVNVAKPMTGPIWDQAMQVAAATIERFSAHRARWRDIWANGGGVGGQYNEATQAQLDELKKQVQAAIEKQHQVNQPKWYRFTLTPTEAKGLEIPDPVTFGQLGIETGPPRLAPAEWADKSVKPIDLRPVVNRGFADENEFDGQGGWSDQGASNDLYSFPIGRPVLAGVPFDILDPAANDGKSMLVLSKREDQKNVASEATIPVNGQAKMLAFLHVGAWIGGSETPVRVRINYADGMATETTFAPGYHLTDWWQASSGLAMGVKAWEGRNRSTTIGAYYTLVANPLPEKVIESIGMKMEGNEWVYGLIAVTALQE